MDYTTEYQQLMKDAGFNESRLLIGPLGLNRLQERTYTLLLGAFPKTANTDC